MEQRRKAAERSLADRETGRAVSRAQSSGSGSRLGKAVEEQRCRHGTSTRAVRLSEQRAE